ncbi:DNA primase [Anaerovorax odorimutans]|uniref:DNA primase n=1 Tax=Anaerovorax odorimutans TaxID=109327 RepID=UPI00040461CF|nr:DNA primase [Anaerovorax odorimutans]
MSIGFNENLVNEIKSRCNIVDVIGRHVSLKKTGSNYKGVCPFHNEKTPSFVVSESKQIFTCFGCGATGDVIAFVERYYNLDFQEAIEKLAGEYGIEIKNYSQREDRNKNELYEINREAAAFFYRNFKNKYNRAYSYMKKRGLSDEILVKFGIGYADSKWDSLYKYFINKGIKAELLLELGLISYSKGKYFDKYRDRVMFPIINTRGKVIGFGGRAIGDSIPKYLNSPESPIFYKKNNLYGLNLTRQEISKEKFAVLVEGYMDVISLYQNGIRNVSASLGTALTDNQAIMLKRYTDNIVLSYDSDDAGQAATLRGLDILHKTGCKVKALNISDGKDPDEFIKKNGKDEYLKLIQKALSFVDYKISILKNKYDINTTEGSVIFLQETAKILQRLSPIEADIYIKKIAKETKISEGAIRLEIYGNNNTEKDNLNQNIIIYNKHKKQEKNIQSTKKINLLEKNFIKLMLTKSSYIPRIIPYEDIFSGKVTSKIYQIILSIYNEDEEIDIKKVEDSLEPEENEMLKEILDNIYLADKEEDVFLDCVASIENKKIAQREKQIIKILSVLDEEDNKKLDDNGNEYSIEDLMKEFMEIQSQKNDRRNRRV